MGRVRASITVLIRAERLDEFLAALPEARLHRGDDAQSAGDGEAELSVVYDPPAWTADGAEDPLPTQHLFAAATYVTACLYDIGVPCRIVSWGSWVDDE
jgi:hypothetical protein